MIESESMPSMEVKYVTNVAKGLRLRLAFHIELSPWLAASTVGLHPQPHPRPLSPTFLGTGAFQPTATKRTALDPRSPVQAHRHRYSTTPCTVKRSPAQKTASPVFGRVAASFSLIFRLLSTIFITVSNFYHLERIFMPLRTCEDFRALYRHFEWIQFALNIFIYYPQL
jgi:hypothetical protein